MTLRTPRFVGFAVAFAASTCAIPLTAPAQTASEVVRDKAVFDAAARSAVTGTVLDRSGRPQIGVHISLLDSDERVVADTFTDGRGHYRLPRLGAGMYQIEATNTLFLPTLRTNLRLLDDSRMVVDLTLTTLYQALQWLPVERQDSSGSPDDWTWTLRLSTNRPLLRMLGPEDARKLGVAGMVVVDSGEGPGASGRETEVGVRSGLCRFGQGGLEEQTAWSSQQSDGRALLLAAQTAFSPTGGQRIESSAGYLQQLSPDRSMITVVTMADRPDIEAGSAGGLVTMRMRSASSVHMGDLAKISGGTELVAAHLGGGGTVLANHPFAGIAVYEGKSTIEYRISTAPTMTDADNLQAEAAEDSPAMVAAAGQLLLEAGLHQELDFEQQLASGHLGTVTGQFSAFHDSISHPMLEGAVSGGEAAVDSQNVLYDPGTGTIAVSGKGYSGGGVMAMLRDQLSPDTWLSLRYALGEAITLPGNAFATDSEQVSQDTRARETPMVALAANTRVPGTGTLIHASYRWQPVSTLTSVAPFVWEVPDAYVSFSLRQPLHFGQTQGGRFEAIVDVRNLLAQGYRPFLSQDGTTVYFAQEQRCIAAGVRFSF